MFLNNFCRLLQVGVFDNLAAAPSISGRVSNEVYQQRKKSGVSLASKVGYAKSVGAASSSRDTRRSKQTNKEMSVKNTKDFKAAVQVRQNYID